MGSFCTGGNQVSQTQTYTPSGQGLEALNSAQSWLGGVNPGNAPGLNVNAPNANQTGAYAGFGDVAANNPAASYYGQSRDLLTQSAQAPNVNNYLNPYMTGALDNLKKYVFDPQRTKTMGAATQAAGGIGAERSALTSQNLDKTQGDALTGALANYYGQATQQGFQERQNQAAAGYGIGALGGQDLQSKLAAYNAQQGSGNNLWGYEQAPNQAAYQQQMTAFQTPFQLAAAYGSLAPAYGGTQSGTKTYPQQSPMSQVVAGVGAVAPFFVKDGGRAEAEGYASGGMPGMGWTPFDFGDLKDAPKSGLQQTFPELEKLSQYAPKSDGMDQGYKLFGNYGATPEYADQMGSMWAQAGQGQGPWAAKAEGGTVNPFDMGEGYDEGGIVDEARAVVEAAEAAAQRTRQGVMAPGRRNSPYEAEPEAATGPTPVKTVSYRKPDEAPKTPMPPTASSPFEPPATEDVMPRIPGTEGLPDWLGSAAAAGPLVKPQPIISGYDPASKPTGSPVAGGSRSSPIPAPEEDTPAGAAPAEASPYAPPQGMMGEEPPLPQMPEMNDWASKFGRDKKLAIIKALGSALAATGERDSNGLLKGTTGLGSAIRGAGVGMNAGAETVESMRKEARTDAMDKFRAAMQQVPYTNLTAKERFDVLKPVEIGRDIWGKPIRGQIDPKTGTIRDITTGKSIDLTQIQEPSEEALRPMAKMIANYDMAPMTPARSLTPAGMLLTKMVAEENPKYDAKDYAAASRAKGAFAAGPEGRAVRSFVVALNHIELGEQLFRAMANNDVRALNALRNVWRTQMGSELPTNFNIAKNFIGSEVAKAVIGNQSIGQERNEFRDMLNGAAGPEQGLGALTTFKRFMVGQVEGLHHQYETATKSPDFEKYLTGAAKREYEKYRGNANPAATPPSAVGSVLPKFGSPTEVKEAIKSGKLKKGDKFLTSDGREGTVP